MLRVMRGHVIADCVPNRYGVRFFKILARSLIIIVMQERTWLLIPGEGLEWPVSSRHNGEKEGGRDAGEDERCRERREVRLGHWFTIFTNQTASSRRSHKKKVESPLGVTAHRHCPESMLDIVVGTDPHIRLKILSRLRTSFLRQASFLLTRVSDTERYDRSGVHDAKQGSQDSHSRHYVAYEFITTAM